MTFAELLKHFLDNSKQTQVEVADAVGVKQSLVSKWLLGGKGKVVTPHCRHWPALARCMNIHWEQVGAAVYVSLGVRLDQGPRTPPADLLGRGLEAPTPKRQITTRNRRDKRFARQLHAAFDQVKVIAVALKEDAEASGRRLTKP